MNMRYVVYLLAVSLMVSFWGCRREKLDKDFNSQTIAKEQNNTNLCGVFFHFVHLERHEQYEYDSIYISVSDSNIASHYLNGNFARLSKNKYLKIIEDFDIGDVAHGLIFIAQSLWSNDETIVFKQPDAILNAKDDREKDRVIRNNYPEIPAELYPLPGEKNYIESDTDYEDGTRIVAFYKNVLYFYDTFALDNYELTCHGELIIDKGPKCQPMPCVAHLRAIVIDLDGEGKLKTTMHTSREPEYFDGEYFRPLFASDVDESLLKQYDLVKASSYPLFKGENRTFAFYPYPTNSDRRFEQPMHLGSTLFATWPISLGSEDYPCLEYGVNSWSAWFDPEDVSGEQSIILNIPDEKLPTAVSSIKDEISKAPNGCGYIDWEKEELVFGDVRYKADWLPYVNGIYWFDSDEEFPLELFAPKKSKSISELYRE